MTAQHHFSESALDDWFHPVILPPEPYAQFVRDLNTALAELEKREGVRIPFAEQRSFSGLLRKPK